MDTKLKNNNKRGNLLTVIVLLISSVGMLLFYPAFSSYITDQDQKEMRKEEQMLDMLDPILDGNYLLYNEISNETESSEVIEEYGNSRFGLMKKYMKYGIFDESGTAMLTSDESTKQLPEEFDGDTYALCVRFSFDVDGDISDIQVGGTAYDKNLQFTAEQWLYDNSVYSAASYISTPSEVQIMYAMTEQNLEAYLEQYELGGTCAPIADFDLLMAAVESAKELGVKMPVGNLYSSDTFYDAAGRNMRFQKMGVMAVEMEAAGLYWTAQRLGKKALAILTISDHIFTGEALSAQERQDSFHEMMEIALETAWKSLED